MYSGQGRGLCHVFYNYSGNRLETVNFRIPPYSSNTGTRTTPVSNYYRPAQRRTLQEYESSLMDNRSDFKTVLITSQYTANEITVKIDGPTSFTVEGKHVETQEDADVSSQFTQKFTLPDGHDINGIYCKIASNGLLTITVPRINKPQEQRLIPVFPSGLVPPHHAMQSPCAAIGVPINRTGQTSSVTSVDSPVLNESVPEKRRRTVTM